MQIEICMEIIMNPFSITGYPLRKIIRDGPRIRLKEKKNSDGPKIRLKVIFYKIKRYCKIYLSFD